MLQISQNYTKKCRKKQMRSRAIIEKDAGLVFVETPTTNIVLCNSGLSNGLSPEILIQNFAKYGPIKTLHMLPGKSYCYIIYKDIQDAKTAYTSCNGILNLAQDEKPVYLAYALEILNLPQKNTNSKPPGLQIIENIISVDDEDLLIKLVCDNTNKEENQFLKHRMVKHFGFEFKYGINNIDRNDPLDVKIPKECEKLYAHMGFIPDQLTVNCYNSGQGIPPHVDTHSAFIGPIVSLSLGSDIIMDFRHADGRLCSVLLPKRSLTIMSGESRYDWTHGITSRKLDIVEGVNGLSVIKRSLRVSYTFRKVNMEGVCKCDFPAKCDTQRETRINEEEARKLEDIHVHQVYNHISTHFSDTRHKPWPNVLSFVNSFGMGSIVIDIGCGNGKNIGHNVNSYEIGCDNSTGLLNLCQNRNLEVFACNCLTVPFKDSIADGIISIAVIHHLGSGSRRRQAIAEIVRLLRVGGQALIYVWAKDQNVNEKSSYLKQDRKNRKTGSCIDDTTKRVNISANIALSVHTNRKQFAEQDMLVPWKLKTKEGEENKNEDEFLRFYHVFKEHELHLLVQSFDNVNICKYYYDQGNWCIIFEKMK